MRSGPNLSPNKFYLRSAENRHSNHGISLRVGSFAVTGGNSVVAFSDNKIYKPDSSYLAVRDMSTNRSDIRLLTYSFHEVLP